MVFVMMISDNFVMLVEFVDLEEVKSLMKFCWIEKLLVYDGLGKLIGLLIFKDIEKVVLNLIVCKDELGCLCVVVVIFVGDVGFEWIEVLIDVGVDIVVIDIVYGYL